MLKYRVPNHPNKLFRIKTPPPEFLRIGDGKRRVCGRGEKTWFELTINWRSRFLFINDPSRPSLCACWSFFIFLHCISWLFWLSESSRSDCDGERHRKIAWKIGKKNATRREDERKQGKMIFFCNFSINFFFFKKIFSTFFRISSKILIFIIFLFSNFLYFILFKNITYIHIC